jgi:hypothetical protein
MGTSTNTTIFVQPAKVLTRMQINSDLVGVADVLISALVGAQLHIQSLLASTLEKKEYLTKYYLDTDAFSSIQPDGLIRVELPTGFVRTDSTFTLMTDTDWRFASPDLIPASDYEVDALRGRLVLDPIYGDQYVRAAFTAGFTPGDASDLESTPPEAIPDWLEEAIISYVGIVLDVSQTTNRAAAASDQYKRAGDHAMSIVAPYLRIRGFAFRPI